MNVWVTNQNFQQAQTDRLRRYNAANADPTGIIDAGFVVHLSLLTALSFLVNIKLKVT